ncbi:hypothetical protein [Bradyrhizobium arachidis]|uniref:hypothetical protein n=1 Tax=Bradyrhizobium arachidis TaxID=858423 RepID=UPI002163EB47|nr:hypothetical protein [Bradyrhizobium arachidis]UVO30337.1 hypothetical protein KUF59_06235 [Bradyrhizobium arachidis]
MLTRLAGTIEQLDLAAEHLAHGDPNNARFALMLSDNIVELTLHQHAKEKRKQLKANSWTKKAYEHEKALEKALGRWFDEKVRFVTLIGKLHTEVGESIRIAHQFRNDVYHVGLQHEAVLPVLDAFYFELTRRLCADYEIRSWGYSPGQSIPERAKKYITADKFFTNFIEEYRAACVALTAKSGHDDKRFSETLAGHLDEVIATQDRYIGYIATNARRRATRDEVVVSSQSWRLAFSEEGRVFARNNGFPGGHIVEWLEQNYPFKFKSDPIGTWRKRSERLRRETDPHKALKMYRTFMDDTAEFRECIEESTSAVDQYVETQIERMREERALARERNKST